MMTKVVLVFLLFAAANSQKDIGRNVKEELQECYNTTFLYTRDNRLPATLNVLLDLIRRIEDSKTVLDIRSVALNIVHRFRQDGIVQLPSKNSLSLPFSPNGYQSDRSRLLIQKFLPGDSKTFPEDSLNSLEKCSLHFIISNMFETKPRDGENQMCDRLGRYTRRSRAADAEMINTRTNEDIETIHIPIPRGYDQSNISLCPVLSGVIYTKYGDIQAGTVVSAIAAAFDNQVLPYGDYEVSSIFVSTLSGDIVETALQQGIMEATHEIGVKGGWNSTLVPRWYFVKPKFNQMTDTEIRGGMDGLIIAKNILDWKSRVQNIKLSQVLDMYYSPRGVFSKYKACNRTAEITAYTSDNKLLNEVMGFAHMYSIYGDVKATVQKETLPQIVLPALVNFNRYISSLHIDCEENIFNEKIATEVIIVVDTEWPYNFVQPALAHLLDQLEINKYESNYTLISAGRGEVIINASYSILEFHENFTESVYKKLEGGFQLTEVMPIVEERIRQRLEGERRLAKTSGKSQIVLFVPHQKQPPSSVSSFIESKMADAYKNFFPDVKFLVLATGNKDSYSSLVYNTNDDIFILPDMATNENDIKEKIKELVTRFASIPRKISNPRCGGYMLGEISTNAVDLYIEQGAISYYKVSPNYFFGSGDRAINVQVQTNSLKVCSSRTQPLPRDGTSDVQCKEVGAGGKEVYDLSDTCVDTVSNCPPFYISFQAPILPNANTRCTDAGCRYPDSIKFGITFENAICKSGAAAAAKVAGSVAAWIAVMILLRN